MFLAVPSGHPIARRASAGDGQFPVLDIRDLQYEPFILMDKYSTMRTMVDQIFADGGFSPNILFETGNNLAVISMVQASLGCGILAWYYVKERPEGITFFCLPGHPTWEFVACHKKDHYLNNAANVYIDLAKQLWGEVGCSCILLIKKIIFNQGNRNLPCPRAGYVLICGFSQINTKINPVSDIGKPGIPGIDDNAISFSHACFSVDSTVFLAGL